MTNLSSFLLGSLVTLICALIPFIISSRQLSNEAKRLAKLSTLVIRGIEESGLAKFSRDEKGNPVGLRFDITVEN